MSNGNWGLGFEVGDTVYFRCEEGFVVEAEIIAIHDPWLWVTDGGGLHTVDFHRCHENPEDVEYFQGECW